MYRTLAILFLILTAASVRAADTANADGALYLEARKAFADGRDDRAMTLVNEGLKKKSLLEEELHSLRAQVLEKQGHWDEDLAENRQLLEMAPNFHLRFDANLRRGRALRAQNKFREARGLFVGLEKKSRGTPGQADVMIELARTEHRLRNYSGACRWMNRLYRSRPLNSVVKDWGPDLASDDLDGERFGCHNSQNDFRDRIRSLMFAGLEEKARAEVQQVSTNLASSDRLQADELRAWFLLQNGEPDEAYKFLEPILPQHSDDADFLVLFSSAAARSGHGNAAVGAYYHLWELSERKEKGKKALYQSAFLSYQFEDYDGAARRFRQFIEKYPQSGLVKDARWNLAWISYLKKDFVGALARFNDLANRKRSGTVKERADYWMAMSHLRLNHIAEAKSYFEKLARDTSGSYYGFAAKQRLASLPATVVAAAPAPAESPVVRGPFRGGQILGPGTEGFGEVSAPAADDTDSEDKLAVENEDDTMLETSTEEIAGDLAQESGRSEVLNEPLPVKAPANARRFDRAKLLAKIGLGEDARWELFEIERHTQSKEELKSLVAAYENLGQWNRSSSIATLRFSSARSAGGFDGAKNLWESAYPRAYLSDVRTNARKNVLPEEFIWGIMRAESQYRKEAVSPVGALGLMQIMPSTGMKIAKLAGDQNFQPQQLLDSGPAIHIGSFYLKRLAKQFNNSIPLAAAAYNAGPHRVHSWLLSFGALDMDEFIEHIPFLETRDYVRKVVANATVYRGVYRSGSTQIPLAVAVEAKGKAENTRRESWDPE